MPYGTHDDNFIRLPPPILPPRPLDEILQTGAGWISEVELEEIIHELQFLRAEKPNVSDLYLRCRSQSLKIANLEMREANLIIELHASRARQEFQAVCLVGLFAILTALVAYLCGFHLRT